MNKVETKAAVHELKDGAERYLMRRNKKFKKTPRLFNKNDIVDYLGIDKRTVDRYVKQLGFDPKPKTEDDPAWSLSIGQVYKIRDALPESMRRQPKFNRGDRKLQVILLQNQKGGVGKTVCAATLAAGLATEYHEEFRVGLIDLDGQSTLTMYHAPNAHEDGAFSVGDLITSNYQLDQGETYEQLVSDSFLKTLVPNLRILPALQSDRSIESWFHEQLSSNGGLQNPYAQVKKIINAVEHEFDVIFIDTPPSLSFMTYNGYFAATSVLFPLAMSENDIDATCNYFSNLPSIWQLMDRAGHEGYDFLRLLLTNHREAGTMTTLKTDMTKFFSTYPYSTPFKYSEAVQVCSSLMSTVFEMSRSEYPKTKKSFDNAKENSMAVLAQVYENIELTWKAQEENNNG